MSKRKIVAPAKPPEGYRCQEASVHSPSAYHPCARPAAFIMRSDGGGSREQYAMCAQCADHNTLRGFVYVDSADQNQSCDVIPGFEYLTQPGVTLHSAAEKQLLDFARVVEAYIKTRDEKEALAEKHKAELAPLNENLKKMEGWFLAKLNEAGLKNAKTEHGTVLTVERCNIKVTDRGELEIFASQHDLDFFVAEVDTKAIKEYLDNSASRGVPPGIEVSYLVSAQVRRA